mmetsp:Transcript_49984/g.109247  ORF Transcript_49984/g.109247 Transcript_49984/m.109247 type:complete len:329 (-) Transcript_49984:842-1828(-)
MSCSMSSLMVIRIARIPLASPCAPPYDPSKVAGGGGGASPPGVCLLLAWIKAEDSANACMRVCKTPWACSTSDFAVSSSSFDAANSAASASRWEVASRLASWASAISASVSLICCCRREFSAFNSSILALFLSIVWDRSLAAIVFVLRCSSQSCLSFRSSSCSLRRLTTISSIFSITSAKLLPCVMNVASASSRKLLVWVMRSVRAARASCFRGTATEDSCTKLCESKDFLNVSLASSDRKMDTASWTAAISSFRAAARASNSVALAAHDDLVWLTKRSSSVRAALKSAASSSESCLDFARAAPSSAAEFFASTAVVSSESLDALKSV